MTAFNKSISFVIISLLFLSLGCNKGFDADSLLDNAIEYTGVYPNAEVVVFSDHGSDKSVKAYPGQVVVFFKSNTSSSSALDIITENGSKIIAQLPSIGYYLLEVNASQASSTINKLNSNTSVEMAFPHVVGYLRGNVNIMDFCGDVHGQDVLFTLKNCGGTFSECKNLALSNTACTRCTSPAKVINGILDLAKKSDGGPTLINLSANGGLESDVDWSKQSNDVKLMGLQGWYWFMFEVLMTIRALPEEVRSNLIITVAAGNEKMPIDDVLRELRLRDGFSEILSKNVLIVSTQKNNGFGNYALSDPDVVVLNNQEASLGTSLAAPCALGFIDSVMRATGISPSEAITAIKASSETKDRIVYFPNFRNMVGADKFRANSSVMIGDLTNGECIWKLNVAFDSLVINWNGSSGSMKMPIRITDKLISGKYCTGEGLVSGTASGSISGNNVHFEGILPGVFNTGKGSSIINFKFVGSKTSSSTITGVLTSPGLAAIGGFNGSINVVLVKQ